MIVSIAWVGGYASYKSAVNQYYAVRQTIENARDSNMSDIERAALITTIIEVNQSLADAKYWNKTIFQDAILDEYANLEYLK